MSQTNEYQQRKRNELWRLTMYSAAIACCAWTLSYFSHYSAAQNGEAIWFTFFSIVTFVAALTPRAPEVAAVTALAAHLDLSADETGAALALLDQYGVLEFTGEADRRAVRIMRDTRS